MKIFEFLAKINVIPAGIAGIQKPWMVTCHFHMCSFKRFANQHFHIPVDWIPAIPAGMTSFCILVTNVCHRNEGTFRNKYA